MTEDSPATDADKKQLKWPWVVRRVFGVIAPLIVLALALLIFLMFADIPEEEGGLRC